MSSAFLKVRLSSLKPTSIVRCYAKQTTQRPKTKTALAKKSKSSPEDLQIFERSGAKSFLFKSLSPSSLANPAFQPGVPELNFPFFTSENISASSIGTVMTLKEPPCTFNAFGLPLNILLDFRLLLKPCSVVRESTLRAMNILDKEKEGSSQNSRIVITGDPGCGKSFVLFQAVNYALQSGWIVLYVPRAISFLDSSTSYEYDPRTRIYQQPAASQQLLRRFLSVNNPALQTLKITHPINIGKLSHFQVGMPLVQLIDAGVKNPQISSDVLSVMLEQLEHQTDYPILLAADDFQALYRTSKYRDPDFNHIQSYHLSVPRLLLEYAGGLRSFKKGAVLGAISSTDSRFQAPLELREALRLTSQELLSSYEPKASALVQYTHGLRSLQVPAKLNIPEAIGLFDLWSSHLALHTRSNDELFHSKYTESSGNARQFVRGLLGTLET